jgi:biotin carboxyl carrier protein
VAINHRLFLLVGKGGKEPQLAQEKVEAPITGRIVSVDVKVGDIVKEDDVICVLESMKMENPIVTPVGGTVVEIRVAVDQVVKPGDIIAVIDY